MKYISATLCFIFTLGIANCFDLGAPVTYLMLIDKMQQAIPQDFEAKLRDLQFFNSDKHDLFLKTLIYDSRFPEESLRKACRTLASPLNAIFDFTLGGWPQIRDLANVTGTPYLQVELTTGPFFRTVTNHIEGRGATRAVYVFQSEMDMISAEYALADEFEIEILYFVGLNVDSFEFLNSNMRPDDYLAIFYTSNEAHAIFNEIVANKLVDPDKLITCLLDFEMSTIETDFADLHLEFPEQAITLIRPSISLMCCPIMNDASASCSCPPKTKIIPVVLSRVADLFLEMVRKELSVIRWPRRPLDFCNLTSDQNLEEEAAIFKAKFHNLILDILPNHQALEFDWDKKVLGYQTVLEVISLQRVELNETERHRFKRQTKYGIQTNLKQVEAPSTPGSTTQPLKAYVVAVADDEPWSYRDGNRWIGYCVDMMQKLSEMGRFTTQYVRINDYGSKQPDSSYNGVIGQLIKGDVDIIAAPLPVTSDLDDAINFVEPSYERVGLSIVTMVPQISKSLFKFATVLSPAVWASTFGALVAMSFVIYIFEILSPFSYRNDPARYPYPCRTFSYYESIWFAATSFTPQGGGECPRPLSVRVVIFGFWIFVVLMLSTFTSNLAAFLTVERAQSTLDSLESLARQTRVAYAVQKGGKAFNFFDNMKSAEDLLYTKWVEKVEGAMGADANTFRTWNYPIREMYKIIWEQLRRTNGFLDTPAEGIRKVLAKPDGSFAFIHDSTWIKYEVLQDCRLTEVGEVFAEQPIALAVNNNNNELADALGKNILVLQRDRYFEELTSKHWNTSYRSTCEGDTKSEGISLESIGGIFIFTFAGLTMAFIIVLIEVLYQQRVMSRAKRTTRAMFATPPAASDTKPGDLKQKRKRKSTSDLNANAKASPRKNSKST